MTSNNLKSASGAGLLLFAFCALGSCSGVDRPAESRPHDDRAFSPVTDLGFEPRPGATAFYGTYDALQGSAVYTAELPQGWDGDGLVMYTHGYRGTGPDLQPSVPPDAWRETVLEAGYAWAASSYSANYYDVRAGVEDTNKLALELNDYLQRDWNVSYEAPSQYLISGMSLGGHTAAAAVDRENRQRTLYPVPYAGAAPFCQAEQNQFQWLGDYSRVAQVLAGYGDVPHEEFQSLLGDMDPQTRQLRRAGPIIEALFEIDPQTNLPTWQPANLNGERLMRIAMNLTGGERPIFEHGFRSRYQNTVFASGGSDGTVSGVLDRNFYDNSKRVYRWTTGDITQEELAFNENVERVDAARGVNALRDDGVRWFPLVQGDFDVPVLTMHTLGDFYVPFRHQQLYREGAIRHGNEHLLVQRAIRAPGHCDFSPQEISTALADWLAWVNGGETPDGDDVLDAAVVAAASYGCTYTTPDRQDLPLCQKR